MYLLVHYNYVLLNVLRVNDHSTSKCFKSANDQNLSNTYMGQSLSCYKYDEVTLQVGTKLLYFYIWYTCRTTDILH